jgi:hypothetical protein
VNKPKYKVFEIETDDVKDFKKMANRKSQTETDLQMDPLFNGQKSTHLNTKV